MDEKLAVFVEDDELVNSFHRLYYDSGPRTWRDTYFLGVTTYKCPLDLWVYQEIVFETRPDLIVETGTACGGSGLYLASLCDLVGNGEVVSIDIERPEDLPSHKRLTFLTGSSVSDQITDDIRSRAAGAQSVLVILDSDHSRAHVSEELRVYSSLVTVGSYLIVEDTNINGHPVYVEFGEGPWEAVRDFLEEDDRYVIDRTREKFFMTFNPSGFLRRIH
jgi:cephalosporin hydroxylase